MAEFRTAAKVSEVAPGQVRQVELDDGTNVCLANVGGTFHAIAGACSHMGGPLAEGELEDTVITCPWHGSMFDVTTGEVLGPPADDSVARYEVRVRDGEVQLAIEPLSMGTAHRPRGR